MSEKFIEDSEIDIIAGVAGAVGGLVAAVYIDVNQDQLRHNYTTAVANKEDDSASAKALQHFGATHPDLSSTDRSSLEHSVSNFEQLHASVNVPEAPLPIVFEGFGDVGAVLVGTLLLNVFSKLFRRRAYNRRNRRNKDTNNTPDLVEAAVATAPQLSPTAAMSRAPARGGSLGDGGGGSGGSSSRHYS